MRTGSPWIAAFALAMLPAAAFATDGAPPNWSLSSLYSYSSLSDDRGDWNEGELELTDRLTPSLTLGGQFSVRNRSTGTDKIYGLLASYRLAQRFEVHGNARFAPSPTFSARRNYNIGAEWRAVDAFSMLADLQWMSFPQGSLHMIKPGFTLWASEDTFLTARYTYGRAYSDRSFTAYMVRGTIGLPHDASLTLVWSHGTDPEKDPGIPGVLLTMANAYDASVRLPLGKCVDFMVGGEYEDRHGLYTRRMGSIGLSVKF